MGHIDGYYPASTEFCGDCGRALIGDAGGMLNGELICNRCAEEQARLEPCEYCDALGAEDHSEGCPNSEYPTDPDDDPHGVRP